MSKMHHCLIGGVAGNRIHEMFFGEHPRYGSWRAACPGSTVTAAGGHASRDRLTTR